MEYEINSCPAYAVDAAERVSESYLRRRDAVEIANKRLREKIRLLRADIDVQESCIESQNCVLERLLEEEAKFEAKIHSLLLESGRELAVIEGLVDERQMLQKQVMTLPIISDM
ncbi:hypothetical protein PHLCEN_2v11155 [Hermanssonia centrifuga]|uniref:Uncharacterized protein n=1 Tax=Hermanssonia centrifuga TaxID=98765 RepID=A0A2R6NKQ6_9APHY|nr:hypothetical protein PHLCEN_2v11155 [Hermanssonia centrifuga]